MISRIPPLPPWMKNRKRGYYSWCDNPILPGERLRPNAAYWHKSCAEEWNRLWNWRYIRHLVYLRDGKICQSCGLSILELGYEYEIDHIRPLWSWRRDIDKLTRLNKDRFYFPWSMGNLQTLCPSCHKWKTRIDRERYKDMR